MSLAASCGFCAKAAGVETAASAASRIRWRREAFERRAALFIGSGSMCALRGREDRPAPREALTSGPRLGARSVGRDEAYEHLRLGLVARVGREVEVVAAVYLLDGLDVERAELGADPGVRLRLFYVRVGRLERVHAVVGLEAHARLRDEEGALAVVREVARVVVVDDEGRGAAALDCGAHRLLGAREVAARVEQH